MSSKAFMISIPQLRKNFEQMTINVIVKDHFLQILITKTERVNI